MSTLLNKRLFTFLVFVMDDKITPTLIFFIVKAPLHKQYSRAIIIFLVIVHFYTRRNNHILQLLLLIIFELIHATITESFVL